MKETAMSRIQLNLTIAEVNCILTALGRQPYAEVFQLVAAIHEQSNAQLPQNRIPPPQQITASRGVEETCDEH